MELQFSQQHQSTPVPSPDKVCSALRYRSDLLVADMNTMEAFHMRCQRQILDMCRWVHVSNAEVLQRSSLSTIDDILRHRRLSLFGHVARIDWIDSGIPAQPRCSASDSGYIWRKKANCQLEKAAGSPSQRLHGSTRFRRMPTLYCYVCCGDMRSPGVMDRRNGSADYATTTMMMMKDVRLVSKMEGKTNFQGTYRLSGNGIVGC